MTRRGLRQWPKSKRSHRVVPVPAHLLEDMSVLMAGRPRDSLASWLVRDGVPLYDVQALLGHEDYATTQRYAHLAPDAHGKVLESWNRRLGASVAHDVKKGRSR